MSNEVTDINQYRAKKAVQESRANRPLSPFLTEVSHRMDSVHAVAQHTLLAAANMMSPADIREVEAGIQGTVETTVPTGVATAVATVVEAPSLAATEPTYDPAVLAEQARGLVAASSPTEQRGYPTAHPRQTYAVDPAANPLYAVPAAGITHTTEQADDLSSIGYTQDYQSFDEGNFHVAA